MKSKLNKLNLFFNNFFNFYSMKRIFFIICIVLLTISCSDNDTQTNNPYLPNYTFSVDINITLPQYSTTLGFPGNGYLITQQGAGIRGVILFNTGSGFMAYDAACPNQALSDCSTMTLDGINAKCTCDNVKYLLYTGLASGQQYPMKAYRTEVVGNIVRIFN